MSMLDLVFANPLYRLTLTGRTPGRLTRLPPPPPPGDVRRGMAICEGTLLVYGTAVDLSPPPWLNAELSPETIAALHDFKWLHDVAAVGGDKAVDVARRAVASWIEDCGAWHTEGWKPAILGARIANWLSHAALIARGNDDPMDRGVMASLARQFRHLGRTASRAEPGLPRLHALRGLVYGAACGLGTTRQLTASIVRLEHETSRQILADGGHISRSPAQQLEGLAVLTDVRALLQATAQPISEGIDDVMRRMSTMLRFYCYPDGGLALFNGAAEGPRALIRSLINADKSSIPDSAPDSGYERLRGGSTLVMIDCGAPPLPGFDRLFHAGTLSFEMTTGEERLIVNCGASATVDPVWSAAQRATAAHSTVVIADTNSSDLLQGAGTRRRAGIGQIIRNVAEGNTWVTAEHDGYREPYGIIHRRRLYLSHDGDDLRGEDTLLGPHEGHCAVRFHLHPDASASTVQNGASILLRLQSGAAWRFQVAGGSPHLTESIYFGSASARRRTEQIVVSAPLTPGETRIKWALKRIHALPKESKS
jgi:uncharacterized heparinase superfamily protein